MTDQIVMAYSYSELDPAVASMVQSATVDIQAKMRRAAQDIVDIGARLLEVKAALPHGHFGEWLRAEFQWDERQARRFMNVAERFKTDNLSDLQIAPSALYALAAPSTPDEALQEALQIAEQGQRVGTREAKEIIARHKEPAVGTAQGEVETVYYHAEDQQAAEPAFWQPDQNQRDRAARIGYQYNVEVRPATTSESEMWIAYENGVIIATIAATTLDGIYRKLKDRAQVAERAAIAQTEQAQAAPAQRKEALLEGAGHEYVLDQDRVEQLRDFAVEYHGSLTDGQVWHHRLLNDDGEPMYYYTQSQIDTMLDKLWAEASRQDEPVETAALTETQVEQSAPSAPAQRKVVPPDACELDDLRVRFERLGWGCRFFADNKRRKGVYLIEGNTPDGGWTQYSIGDIDELWELLSKLERDAQDEMVVEPVETAAPAAADPAQGLVAEIQYWRDRSKRHEQEQEETNRRNRILVQQHQRLMEQKLELVRKVKRLERRCRGE